MFTSSGFALLSFLWGKVLYIFHTVLSKTISNSPAVLMSFFNRFICKSPPVLPVQARPGKLSTTHNWHGDDVAMHEWHGGGVVFLLEALHFTPGLSLFVLYIYVYIFSLFLSLSLSLTSFPHAQAPNFVRPKQKVWSYSDFPSFFFLLWTSNSSRVVRE